MRPAPGPRRVWEKDGVAVELPVIVTWTREDVAIEATVDLFRGQPAIREVRFRGEPLDPLVLQRHFRWRSPLEVVTSILPTLIAIGEDPYSVELPVDGFPASAVQPTASRLSDEFLRTIASEYLVRGRGYARTLAQDYVVSERTVISWIEKARARGILSPPPANGAHGGELL